MMMKNDNVDGTDRRSFGLATAICALVVGYLAPGAVGEERKFAVLLAVPRKQVPNPPVTNLPNPNDIYDQYFDLDKDDVESFAEYWREISYGNVNITGHVFTWVEIPWPVLPGGATSPPPDNRIPFIDLNGSETLDLFLGESFDETIQMYPAGDTSSAGLDDGVWTPGERFWDLNANGRYDGLGEDTADGYQDRDPVSGACLSDGIIAAGEFCDDDDDGEWDFPEPYEDFLVTYNATAGGWIRLDPSYKNPNTATDPLDPNYRPNPLNSWIGSQAWAQAYITFNYPGDAGSPVTGPGPAGAGSGLMGRCGNDLYDGPDAWIEGGNSKMVRACGGQCLTTPKPTNDWVYGQGYTDWWEAYWDEVHQRAGAPAPYPPPDPPPAWPAGGAIPRCQPLDPSTLEVDFQPNMGGTLFRSGLPGPGSCDPDPADTDPPCATVDPQDFGDGTVDSANSGVGTGTDILPGADGYYDGPAEFEDLPSSIYHARSPSGIGYGGDGRLGEVTSPANTDIWGHDIGDGNPDTPFPPDGIIPAAGPLAYNIHGSNGYDAGNVLTLEFLTWRTEAPPNLPGGSAPGFKRDFNLDGLLDQGEVRGANTENYVLDTDSNTVNDGGPASNYPFNRCRLTEDVVEALDSTADWDEVVLSYGGTNYVFSTVLLPAGLYDTGLAAGGRGYFQLPAPGMDLPIQIHEQPGAPLSPLLLSDFVTSLGDVGEVPGSSGNFGTPLMAHEFLHVWEGYPDLYDYDQYIPGAILNCPVTGWGIMAGGALVHPTPVLKEWGTGVFAPHEPWIQKTNLTTAIEPLVESEVVLTDYAFDPAGSVYYYENPNSAGERFYFWRVTDVEPTDPDQINFSRNLPGEGVLIMHTDLGTNPEARPLQNRTEPYTYYIVQADGLQQMDFCSNGGDAGDPFPGDSGNFETNGWTEDTDPNSRWYEQVRSGISITAIDEQANHSIVTFLWQPRWVPELRFLSPPGGYVLGNDYVLAYQAFDFWGGTSIEFYYDTDNTGHDGNQVGPTADKESGVIEDTHLVPLSGAGGLPGDGNYYFYARLIPGPGDDGNTDPKFSEPRPRHATRGRGMISDVSGTTPPPSVDVEIINSKLELWTLRCTDDTVPGAELWEVEGQLSGVLSTPATTGLPYDRLADAGIAFQINWGPGWGGIEGTNADVANTNGVYLLTDASANFDAPDFEAEDMVRITVGPNPGFYTIQSVPDSNTLILDSDPGHTGGAGGVEYRVHSFTDGNDLDDEGSPDEFIFMTTGKTRYSLPVTILNGLVVPQTYPVIDVSYPDDDTNPGHYPPLRVRFDATGSLDETGRPNTNLVYEWDLG
ncbi:MAG: hypothetical protein GY778_26885, partial [bacterium]|nr:hypothetical protein [bacterium]